MIVLPFKIVIWLAVVKFYTGVERWSIWLGLVVAGIFAVFDYGTFQWGVPQTVMFGGYWCIASVTLWGFVRCEDLLARIAIMGTGSFLLIMGLFLVPYPLHSVP